MAAAAVSNYTIGQNPIVMVSTKNPIVIDTGYGGHEGHIIMSIGLQTYDASTWFFQGFKIDDVVSTSLIPEDPEPQMSVYDLRDIHFFADGYPMGQIDSINPKDNLLTIGFYFALGSRFEVKARFPEGKGVLRAKIMLAFKEKNKGNYEQFKYEQFVYRGIQPVDLSSSMLRLDKIVMCQNTYDRVITLKNLPIGKIIKVYNLQGIIVYQNNDAKSEEEIDLKNLPTGMFIISIGDVTYKKVII